MAGKVKANIPEGFPKKWWDKIPSSWREGAESKDTEVLKQEIFDLEKEISYQERLMDENETLKALKQEVKDLSGGFKDSINAATAKVKYAVHLIKNRSGDV